MAAAIAASESSPVRLLAREQFVQNLLDRPPPIEPRQHPLLIRRQRQVFPARPLFEQAHARGEIDAHQRRGKAKGLLVQGIHELRRYRTLIAEHGRCHKAEGPAGESTFARANGFGRRDAARTRRRGRLRCRGRGVHAAQRSAGRSACARARSVPR